MVSEARIVHRDAALLVLDKPTGLPTTSPKGGARALTDVAKDLDPTAPRLHATSRLDAEVTGLVTFTRTREANVALLEARSRGRYRRTYLALVQQATDAASGCIEGAIAIDPADKRKRRIASGGKPSATDYETLEVLPHGALVAFRPRTGRTHQIRVHAASVGMPLLGDVHYGGLRRVVLPDGRVVTARRTMLHMRELCIPDVARRQGELTLRSPIPEDLRGVYAGLGGGDEGLLSAAAD